MRLRKGPGRKRVSLGDHGHVRWALREGRELSQVKAILDYDYGKTRVKRRLQG